MSNKIIYGVIGFVVVGLIAWIVIGNQGNFALVTREPSGNETSTSTTPGTPGTPPLVTDGPNGPVVIETSTTPTPETTAGTPSSTTSGGSTEVKSYTMTDVAAHKDSTSCWSAVNGSVYDLTSWIGKHPGGQKAILKICGQDGSEEFNEQHGGKQKQADVLATFKIGTLAN